MVFIIIRLNNMLHLLEHGWLDCSILKSVKLYCVKEVNALALSPAAARPCLRACGIDINLHLLAPIRNFILLTPLFGNIAERQQPESIVFIGYAEVIDSVLEMTVRLPAVQCIE